MKIRPVRAELFHAGKQTNGQTDRWDSRDWQSLSAIL